jgi:hypothetical protein
MKPWHPAPAWRPVHAIIAAMRRVGPLDPIAVAGMGNGRARTWATAAQ